MCGVCFSKGGGELKTDTKQSAYNKQPCQKLASNCRPENTQSQTRTTAKNQKEKEKNEKQKHKNRNTKHMISVKCLKKYAKFLWATVNSSLN